MQTVVIYHDQYFNAGYDYIRVLTVIVYFYVSINLSSQLVTCYKQVEPRFIQPL